MRSARIKNVKTFKKKFKSQSKAQGKIESTFEPEMKLFFRSIGIKFVHDVLFNFDSISYVPLVAYASSFYVCFRQPAFILRVIETCFYTTSHLEI